MKKNKIITVDYINSLDTFNGWRNEDTIKKDYIDTIQSLGGDSVSIDEFLLCVCTLQVQVPRGCLRLDLILDDFDIEKETLYRLCSEEYTIQQSYYSKKIARTYAHIIPLAKHKDMDITLLKQIIGIDIGYSRGAIAQNVLKNPNVTTELVDMARSHTSLYVLLDIAKHPLASPDTLSELAKFDYKAYSWGQPYGDSRYDWFSSGNYKRIKRLIAQNVNTPTKLLEEYCEIKDRGWHYEDKNVCTSVYAKNTLKKKLENNKNKGI